MRDINWKYIAEVMRTYVLNKYVLTLIIFMFIFLFVGEQSLIKGIKRNQKIQETKQEIIRSEQAIEHAKRQMHSLQQIDSLEKFAREHYLMHKENEEIFLIDE